MTFRPKHLTPLALLGLLLLPQTASAHVKWFSDFDFADAPRSFSEIVTPTFIALALLSVVVISGMVFIDRRLDNIGWYGAINTWLSDREQHSMTVMRVAMAAVLLISWENQALLTPELVEEVAWVGWFQFALAILLLFPKTAPSAGVGIVLLWLIGVVQYGPFHMPDYLHYVGIGVYLFVSGLDDERLRGLGLPALYATIGFALVWLGFEKLVYPNWTLYILEQNPVLIGPFPPMFFLQAAAFVEIALGFLLFIGLLERPLAAVITLVFFSTTLIFGRIEVIGHTPLHAALVVFLLSGPGNFYRAPINIHKKMNWRVAFAAVNFVLVVLLFSTVYTASAAAQFDDRVAAQGDGNMGMFALDAATAPVFKTIDVVPEIGNNYSLFVEIDNWTFTPALTGSPSVANEGHGHVYLNGDKIGRLYDDWFYLGDLESGEYTARVDLNGNDHQMFAVDGVIISAETTFTVP